ncbi:S41 family peptidase [Paenibacillus hodogayensis]|uniref:S41 family peptidase n=1 Tax=Paenibacillus hodogayensis TaxID=279208 RepID=A0ABV5W3P8_9BACL
MNKQPNRFQGRFRKLKTLSAALALFGMLTLPAAYAGAAKQETPEQYKEVQQLLGIMHISGKTVEDSKEKTIDGLIKTLNDPYTDFFDEEEWKSFQNSLDLNYAGIGMRIGEEEGRFMAVEVFQDSPALAVGLQRGDYIIGVDGKPTAGMQIGDVTGLIRGIEGTEVTIRVQRGDKELDVKPKRGQIHMPVVSGGMMAGGIGYLNVASFSEEADEQFAAMLDVLKSSGIRGLVVDLRNNPGGLLDTAKNIAEQFIERGILIHTRDRNNIDEPLRIENGQTVAFPVVLLVNENSASASEVLTAALQDYKKAVAVGAKTYGKGSVQALYPLQSGGVLKVTVQEYLSPTKRTVNKVGLTPDIPMEGVVPQLLTGLRTAGLQNVTLEVEKHLYRLNGFEFFDAALPSLEKNGGVYLPARVLAAAVGEGLEWNETSQGVEIGGAAGAKHLFDASSGFVNESGTGFIELDRFKEQYPQMSWTAGADKTVLTVKGTES